LYNIKNDERYIIVEVKERYEEIRSSIVLIVADVDGTRRTTQLDGVARASGDRVGTAKGGLMISRGWAGKSSHKTCLEPATATSLLLSLLLLAKMENVMRPGE
jgi:hypothetical protein